MANKQEQPAEQPRAAAEAESTVRIQWTPQYQGINQAYEHDGQSFEVRQNGQGGIASVPVSWWDKHRDALANGAPGTFEIVKE